MHPARNSPHLQSLPAGSCPVQAQISLSKRAFFASPRDVFGRYKGLILPHLSQMALCSWGELPCLHYLQAPTPHPTDTCAQVAVFPASPKGEGPWLQESSSRVMSELGTDNSHLVRRGLGEETGKETHVVFESPQWHLGV